MRITSAATRTVPLVLSTNSILGESCLVYKIVSRRLRTDYGVPNKDESPLLQATLL